jgi:hypothetical protein
LNGIATTEGKPFVLTHLAEIIGGRQTFMQILAERKTVQEEHLAPISPPPGMLHQRSMSAHRCRRRITNAASTDERGIMPRAPRCLLKLEEVTALACWQVDALSDDVV